MFEKFKEDDDVKVAVAVLLRDIITSDNKISSLEIEKFYNIYKIGFDISKEEAESLYTQAKALEGELDLHLKQIKEKFVSNPMAKINLMKVLNEMIIVDEIKNIEYDRFEIIKNELI